MNPIKYLASATAALALALTANALPVGLTLSTNGGATTQFVSIGSNGVASFNGSIGTWTINVVTGESYPALGSVTTPVMDLNFTDTGIGSGASALTINFVDTFGPITAGSGSATIGGTQSGVNVSYNVLENGSAITPTLTFTAPSGIVSYSGNNAGGTLAGASVTFDQQIVLSGSGQASGDSNFAVPDQGMTVVLLALGLTALGLVAWKRNEVQTSA